MSESLDQFTNNVHRNNYYNVVWRVVGIILSFLFTRYNIAYLGASLYGLWLTIASITSWANLGNLGIGNGLRNELAKAIAQEDAEKQRNLIWTAVSLLSKLSMVIFVILAIVCEVLFATDVIDSSLRVPMYITNTFFCISFILGISRSVALSYQLSWLTTFSQTLVIIFNLSAVLLLMVTGVTPNLVIYAILMGVGTLLGNVLIIFNLRKKMNEYLHCEFRGHYTPQHRNSILNVGLQFFVLQICCIILYSTDNVIINKLFDSVQVTKYSVIHSVYYTGEGLFAIFLVSLWSAVTFAAEKGEFAWVKKEVNNLLKIWGLYSVGVIGVSVLFNPIVNIWLGDGAMYYEPSLVAMFAIYTILTQFGSIYVNVTNGLGRIKLQMICSVIGAVLNIPLSIILATTCGLGLKGIILATLLCCFGSWVLVPIDIISLLKRENKQ